MFQGKAKSFSKVSEFQDKWHVDPRETGARKGTEYDSISSVSNWSQTRPNGSKFLLQKPS